MIPVSIGSFGGRDAWLPDYRYGTHVVRTKPEDEARERVIERLNHYLSAATGREMAQSEWNDVMDALSQLRALTKGDA